MLVATSGQQTLKIPCPDYHEEIPTQTQEPLLSTFRVGSCSDASTLLRVWWAAETVTTLAGHKAGGALGLTRKPCLSNRPLGVSRVRGKGPSWGGSSHTCSGHRRGILGEAEI